MTALKGTLKGHVWAGLLRPGYSHIHDPAYESVDVAVCGAVVRPADPAEPLIPCPTCHGGPT